jgi:hypothetical protein
MANKFAIVSDVKREEDKLVSGALSIRKLVAIEFLGDVYNGDSSVIIHDDNSHEKENITTDEMRKELVVCEFINEFTRANLPNSFDGLQKDDMYIVKHTENCDSPEYHLYVMVSSEVKHWFSSEFLLTPKYIGKFATINIEHDCAIDTEHTRELRAIIVETSNEKTEILAQSCNLESQVKQLGIENNFMRSVIERFQDQVNDLDIKRKEDQEELVARVKRIEEEVAKKQSTIQKQPVIQKQHNRVEQVRGTSSRNNNFEETIHLLANFDRRKLRPIGKMHNMTASTF